jgi:predicted GNAT superfamily acetyltransferase
MLKEHQRSMMAQLQIKRIFWTFDPLMAKNAYFNFNRLGARVIDYVPDMYGTTQSPLHYGLATDRLVVCIDTDANGGSPVTVPSADGLPVMSAFPRPGDQVLVPGEERPALVLLEIPTDVLELMGRSPAQARVWRTTVREQFQWALWSGYATRGVHREPASGRCFYVLVSPGAEQDGDGQKGGPLRYTNVRRTLDSAT